MVKRRVLCKHSHFAVHLQTQRVAFKRPQWVPPRSPTYCTTKRSPAVSAGHSFLSRLNAMKKLFILGVILSVLLAATQSRELTKEEFERIQEDFFLTTNHVVIYLGFFLFIFYQLFYPMDFMIGLGVTVENIFSSYFGNSDPDLVSHHSRRVVVNRAVLCAAPFLFFVCLFMTEYNAVVFAAHPTRFVQYLANLSFPLMICGVIYWFAHAITDFQYLDCIKRLRSYSTDLIDLNRQIASELLNMETFKYKISSSSSIIVTQSWIVYFTKFQFSILRVQDVDFHVTWAEDIIVNPMNPEGAVQLLTMRITVPSKLGKDISWKMDNIHLLDLQNALVSRINIPATITVKLSTVDRFSKIFAEQAAMNPPYYIDDENDLEPCLACAENKANMKLVKRCLDNPEDVDEEHGYCQDCNCRPMWCVQCMGKVFAAKQDKSTAGRWLTGKAPCPTCRATFCVIDVALTKVRH